MSSAAQMLFTNRNLGVIGHNNAQNILLSNSNIRCWIFCGERGIGKAILAKNFAKYLVQSEVLTHPDIMYINDENAIIDVNRAREIKNFLLLSSFSARKVLVVDSIDNMNESAINAILKSLEEPSSNSVIILISHRPHSLPLTILSRCFLLKLFNLTNDETRAVLNQTQDYISPINQKLETKSEQKSSQFFKLNEHTDDEVHDLYQGRPGLFGENIQHEIRLYNLLIENIVGRKNLHELRESIVNTKLSMYRIRMVFQKSFLYVMTETIRESQCDKSIKNTIERLLDRWAELDNIFMSSDNLYLGRSEVLINAFYQASIK